MSQLMESGILTEKQSGMNFMYVLNDSNDFLITEYKVLHSQNDVNFIRCMKMSYNGKLTLYYEASGYRTLQDLLPTLDSNSFMNIVSNLLRAVIEVKNNGFLSCQNIDLSFYKIFINGSNLTVRLVYIPLQKHEFADDASFEANLRTKLIQAIHQNPFLQSPSTASLERNLSDSSLSLSSLAGYVRAGEGVRPENISYRSNKSTHQMWLVALRAPVPLRLAFDRDEYIFGKKAGSVNGVITFNSAISRIHCKIIHSGFGYKIEDMGSANGTFVNGKRLTAHKAVSINHGDVVRLANSDFQVVIHESRR